MQIQAELTVINQPPVIISTGYSAELHFGECKEKIVLNNLLYLVDQKTKCKSKISPMFVKKGQTVGVTFQYESIIDIEEFILVDEGKIIAIGKVV